MCHINSNSFIHHHRRQCWEQMKQRVSKVFPELPTFTIQHSTVISMSWEYCVVRCECYETVVWYDGRRDNWEVPWSDTAARGWCESDWGRWAWGEGTMCNGAEGKQGSEHVGTSRRDTLTTETHVVSDAHWTNARRRWVSHSTLLENYLLTTSVGLRKVHNADVSFV